MEREQLVKNLMNFVPSLYKRITKRLPDFEIPNQQFALLFKIKCERNKPMSFYSKIMCISKPNITKLTDNLIKEGLIIRKKDPDDRRVIILDITPKGLEFTESKICEVSKKVEASFSSLTDDEVKKLNSLFLEINSIISKI